MLSTRPLSRASSQRGGTLLEVLVSMLLLAIGLLGMAALSTASSGYNKMSQIRATATLLVSDYTDRARANPAGFDAGSYAKTSAYEGSPTLEAENGCTNAVTSPCTSTALGQLDQDSWLNLLRVRLPGGDAYVTTNTSSSRERTMDIWIMWREQEQADGLSLSPSACPSGAAAPSGVMCLYFRTGL